MTQGITGGGASGLPAQATQYVVVNAADQVDFRNKWATYGGNGHPLWLPTGAYTLTSALATISDSTDARQYMIQGEGVDKTIIQEDTSSALTQLLLSAMSTSSGAKTRLVLKDLTINLRGTSGLDYGLNLPFIKCEFQNVRFAGHLDSAQANKIMLNVGGAGSTGYPSTYIDCFFACDGASNTVDTMFKSWDENANYVGLQLLASSGSFGSHGLYCLGTSHVATDISCFVGNGKTANSWVRAETTSVHIGQIYLNSTGAPTSKGKVFRASADSIIDVGICMNEMAAQLYYDATSGLVTNINGGYGNSTGGVKPLWRVTGNISDGGTYAHGLGITPQAVIATGTVSSNIVTCTAKDATNLTFAIKNDAGAAGTAQPLYLKIMP